MATKEDFKKELEQRRITNNNGYLNSHGIAKLKTMEKYENLILFGVGSSTEQNTERPSGLKDNEWWCTSCKTIVEGSKVTFEERHNLEGCYGEVI